MTNKPASGFDDRFSVDLFLRCLGGVYFIAILSLWLQVDGLIGSRGILPVAPWLEAAKAQLGLLTWTRLPTLMLLDAGDPFLHLCCIAGCVFALLLVFGVLPLVCTISLWVLYLSLTVSGQVFLGFQWDALLLETGFLAIFLAPGVLISRPARNPVPSRLFILLVRWLLFRLMFASGFVKLASGSPSWRDMTALDYHYWTQPLTVWTAWFAHKLPMILQQTGCVIMFLIELVVPFLIFGPRRARWVAAGALIFLQLGIMATGNYGYFNLLAIVLCIPLIGWTLKTDAEDPVSSSSPSYVPAWRVYASWIRYPVFALVITVSLVVFGSQVFRIRSWPAAAERLYTVVAPFRSVNSYGLFASMTTNRPEIEVEGTLDGNEWKPYVFKWKPGALDRRPEFVAPHMPRLDWQMWFAALGNVRGNPWFVNFAARLLENEPSVLGLLKENPFPDEPPRAIRARTYQYTFSTLSELREEGAWWRREPAGEYCPPISLRR